ncbi:hypothetical protein E2C01_024625 [Portunus trituberculatus]|uniref:Uncharacterized protein n=1 Tax=Portunus trituberculatus TaxID=210409 RepID=A0A5B7EDC2_PORTR|nr:hypothetical protein [Portunus trituberculatus]
MTHTLGTTLQHTEEPTSRPVPPPPTSTYSRQLGPSRPCFREWGVGRVGEGVWSLAARHFSLGDKLVDSAGPPPAIRWAESGTARVTSLVPLSARRPYFTYMYMYMLINISYRYSSALYGSQGQRT